MKQKCRGFLYIFFFTTLFLCLFCTQVFAISSQDLIEGHKIYEYESASKTGNGTQALSSYQVIQLPFTKKDIIYDEDTHEIQLTANDYITFTISYKKDGKWVTEEPLLGLNNSGRFELRLSQKIEEGTQYYLSAVESIENIDETNEQRTGEVTEKTTSTTPKDFKIAGTKTQEEAQKTTWFSALWDTLTGGLSELGKILLETFCKIIIPAGDSFLDMVCNSIGEVVTIDRIVYNRVSKLDIDFFNNAMNDIEGENMNLKTPLKSIMGKVVDKLYVFFRNFVIVFYLVMLVYIGLKILSTSTAEKKANYKSILMAWVMGVAMLMFFPYVMKYSIKMNEALCQMISDVGENQEQIHKQIPVNGLVSTQYGTDAFVAHILGNAEVESDAMMNVRYVGAHDSNVPLIIVYFIFIGQLIALLVMYYKRVFMIAFLIAIFPIVVAIYPLNKIGDIRMNPFGEWFREFLVNVFVQSFHAAIYKVIVSMGVNSYASSKNWLFLLVSVLFLFEGEKLIRAIFSAKSSANTIGNMAVAGAFAMKIMRNVGSAIPTLDKKKEEENDDAAAKDKARKDVTRQTTSTMMANANRQAVNTITAGGTSGSTASTSSVTPINVSTSQSVTTINTGINNMVNTSSNTIGTANVDNQISAEKKNRKDSHVGSKILGTGFNIGAQVTGGIVGTTYGMAQTNAKQGLDAAISGFVSGNATGRAIGQSGKKLLADRIDRKNTKAAAMIVAAEYEDGKYDEEIGINEADRQLHNERAQAIRKAYADYVRRSTGWRGKTRAQLDFYKTQMKILNESLDRNKK